MVPEPQGNKQHDDDPYNQIRFMEVRGEGIPVLAKLKAQPGQKIAPRQTAKKRINAEASKVHAGNTGGQRDECPNEGHHTSEEDDRFAKAGKSSVRSVDISLSDE